MKVAPCKTLPNNERKWCSGPSACFWRNRPFCCHLVNAISECQTMMTRPGVDNMSTQFASIVVSPQHMNRQLKVVVMITESSCHRAATNFPFSANAAPQDLCTTDWSFLWHAETSSSLTRSVDCKTLACKWWCLETTTKVASRAWRQMLCVPTVSLATTPHDCRALR